MESELQEIEINSKIYEYSRCDNCNTFFSKSYTSNNFDNGTVKVCLDVSGEDCPEGFFLEDDNNICYQNCKNSGTENIFGNERNNYCVNECEDKIYFYENNICTDICPRDYYYFELEHYCIKKCINSLYHVREEKRDIDNEIYFELSCQSVCPISKVPYSFTDENNDKYCLSTCSQFSFYFSEFETLYNIYYKNLLICLSKFQCNNFNDQYGDKKYVALIKEEISGEISEKRVCVPECKEVGQYLLPLSEIDTENTNQEGVDCTEECPDGYGNNSWVCTNCSLIYYYEYEKNCIKTCPNNSFQINEYPYKCFSSCPDPYPYQDDIDFKCYKTLEEVPLHEEEIGKYCDKTKHLWYTIYNVNHVPIVKCLNDTSIYLLCAAVIPQYPYTNQANHECVQSCPTSYSIQNEHTKFCDLDTNKDIDFNEVRNTLLTHELNDTTKKNETNVIIIEKDYNSEQTISFHLFNYSNVLEKSLNGIKPDVTIQETNGDIRKDPTAPFYYLNGSEVIISDQCEDLLRQSYNIPYFNEYEYIVKNVRYTNGIKEFYNETKKYYIPQYLLGIVMNIKRENTSQVEYKLYNPNNPTVELDLTICSDSDDNNTNTVTINIERNLPQNIYKLYEEVFSYYFENKDVPFEGKKSSKYDYDIFNRNSDFLLNPCAPFTSKYGADILVIDRYKNFYIRIDFCENNCKYLGNRLSYKNLGSTYIQISCKCPIKTHYNHQEDVSFIPVIESDAEIDETSLTRREREILYETRESEHDINMQFIKTQIFKCYKKFINIKSTFSRENILGLLTLVCFLLIIGLYISQCIIGISELLEVLKFIRLGKFDHGISIFFTLADYLRELKKREECYRARKNLKKIKRVKEKRHNEALIQAKHKIKRAEDNLKRKLEGKEMIDEDKKPDELELIRGRVKDLEEKLRLKYVKKGLKDKKIKLHIGKVDGEEDPEEIKNIKKEILMTKKRLKIMKKKKKEIDLEKMKYHSLSSMASIPPHPPKRILSELPMPDEVSDHDEITSKEKMVDIINKEKKKKEEEEKKRKEKEEKKKKKEEEKKEKERKEKEKKKKEKEEKRKLEKEIKRKEMEAKTLKLQIDMDAPDIEEEEEKEEEKKEEKKEIDLISESKLSSSWESYDSNDPKGIIKKMEKKKKEKEDKEKKEKREKEKKEEEKKQKQIKKLVIKKREKEKERINEILPEEEKERRQKIKEIKRAEIEEEKRRIKEEKRKQKEEELRKKREEEELKRKQEEELKKKQDEEEEEKESNEDNENKEDKDSEKQKSDNKNLNKGDKKTESNKSKNENSSSKGDKENDGNKSKNTKEENKSESKKSKSKNISNKEEDEKKTKSEKSKKNSKKEEEEEEESHSNKSKSKNTSNKEEDEKKTKSEKSKKTSNKEEKKSQSNKSKEEKDNEEEKKSENEEKKEDKEDKEKKSKNNEDKDSNKEKNKEEEKNNIDNLDINNLDINNLDINNLPEENLSDLEKENEDDISEPEEGEEDDGEKNENFADKNTENEEIIKVEKKKKPKDKFFKDILKKKYKFKYMRAFYEEAPDNFSNEYSTINFNDLFTSNDFFYLYTDIEINEMIYKRALKEDCRSFCQMFWSFLKYKNNFIFCIVKDYFNLRPIKLSILVYSLSLYPFISCIFITDELLHKIYNKSNENKKHEILLDYSLSIVQYLFSPLIIEVLFFLFKKMVLTENDIIDLIHKKKYHSNYILQEMVKGYDFRDEKDELEKAKILYNIQSQNKKIDEKNNAFHQNYEDFEGVNEGEGGGKVNYEKEYEENKTIINEIRFEINEFPSKINNRQSIFFILVIILSFFHFYYVSVFTMVYYNCTQKLIYSSIISLTLNFIYPTLNCLVFVSIRYFSLNHGFKNYYKLSKFLSFI